jgi:hypothetical protein
MKSNVRFLWVSIPFLLIQGASVVTAQIPTKMWDVRFGGSKFDIPDGIIETPDHGFMIVGVSASNNDGNKSQVGQGYYDFWIVRTDAYGTKLWDRRFGGSDDEGAYDIQITSDSNYLVSGYSSSVANEDKSESGNGNKDFWVLKISPAGNKIWDHCYGANKGEILRGALATNDGGFLLAGYSFSGISGDKTQANNGPEGTSDYWIIKIDSNGVKQWDRSFGGDGEDELTCIARAPGGGFMLAGSSSSGMSGDHSQASQGLNDFWIVSVDSLGNKLWDYRYGGTDDDFLIAITRCTDDGYVLSGYSFSGIGGDKSQDCWGNSDIWLLKIDSNGGKQWDARFGATKMDRSRSVIQTADGGYFVGGYTNSLQEGDITETSRGIYDFWVIKLDSNGTKQWDKRYGGSADDHCHLVMQLADGDYMLIGHSQSDIGGDKSQSCFGSDDIWMIKLEVITVLPVELAQFEVHRQDAGALVEWATLSETGSSYFTIERSLNATAFDSIGMVRGAGTSLVGHDYAYFDAHPPKQLVYYRLKQTDHDGEIVYSMVRAVDLQPASDSQTASYTVYPNPANDFLLIERSEVSAADGALELRNALGIPVYTSVVPGTSTVHRIDLPPLPAGIYTISIRDPESGSCFIRVIIM